MVPNNASNLCSNDIYFLQIWQYALTAKLRAANKHTIRLILDSLVVWETTVKNKRYSAVFFLNWDSLHARLNSHYKAWSYKKKKYKKIKAYRKSV